MSYADDRYKRHGAHPGGVDSTLRLIEMAGIRDGDFVLDLCCGCGDTLELLGKNGVTAVGIDSDPKQVAGCEARGVRAVKAEASSLPFDDCAFDGVIVECSASLLVAAGVWTETQAELLRVLKKGGVVALSDFKGVALSDAFRPIAAEDASDDLKRFAAHWLWEYGELPHLCGCDAKRGYERAVYIKK